MFCGHKISAAVYRAFNVKNSLRVLCRVFYVVGGVKVGLYIGSCKGVEGIARFPLWHSLAHSVLLTLFPSFMSLERQISGSDLYSHKSCTVADLGPYFILTLIIEMRHLGVERSLFLTTRMRYQPCSHLISSS